MAELAKMLLKFLTERKLSIAKLAKDAGVPRANIHGWVTGRVTVNLEQLKRVCETLEVPIHVLAFGSSDPFEDGAEEVLREIFTGDVRVTLHRIERKKRPGSK